MKCDKTTVDPKKHAGPFEFLQEVEKGGKRIRMAHCETCGNVVFRYLKPTGKDYYTVTPPDAAQAGSGH